MSTISTPTQLTEYQPSKAIKLRLTPALKRYKSNIIHKTTYPNVTIKPKRTLKIVK
jgi:hypothetical protein